MCTEQVSKSYSLPSFMKIAIMHHNHVLWYMHEKDAKIDLVASSMKIVLHVNKDKKFENLDEKV